jgi:DNA-binding IclR family transcriptional regulator
MTAAKPSSEETIVAVLGARREATVSDIAAAAGLGRSTVGKLLARLERAGRVRRNTGGRERGRRLPDRWAPAANPRSPARRRASGKRLRPGELDRLVLDYLAKHAESDPLSPTAIANGLGRSAGAVGNCLARLAGGRVRQAGQRPRRYQPV